jgi:ABC-type Fe3+ transport system permease subunit
MRARTQRTGIVAVVAAALTTGLSFAHTLELPQKLGYDAAMWTRIQQSLYLWFGVVGGALEVAAAVAEVTVTSRVPEPALPGERHGGKR